MKVGRSKKATDDDWSTMAALAQDGDQAAYRALLKDISGFIKSYIIGGLANPDWADDITQDVLISVHKSLHTYTPGRPFRSWLISIIHFRRTDFLRKYYSLKKNKTSSLDDVHQIADTNNVTNPERLSEYKEVGKELDSLPEKQKKVFRMMKIEGYSAKEVAKEVGMSVSAVKVSAHRTMNKLKDHLR